ncbi:histone family protein DNA-binding protein [Acidithiobacillus ferrivorans SS3]|uniref:Integration host factor subunit alpha n=1 Tax=Acidithiobacillus ferrivorans SS3 TaxID=743299 RepID=G0JLN5_9PROT|nr:integration host factor subunit alpha [Acidithiobacillus ferrivorans]AEM48084.1 histone family protein DNA-binding protein [Acidithiobacillus ferrivorans SS3]
MTVTKKELMDHLADTTGLKVCESKQLVEDFFDIIRETLASGEEVKLSGFGRFNILDKRSRPGRNPKNGVSVEITARRVVTFTASHSFKQICNPDLLQMPEKYPRKATA